MKTLKNLKQNNSLQSGFTLIELLIVIVIITALAVTVFVALNPVKRTQDARNARRQSDVETILTAIHEYIVDKSGTLPTGLSTGMAAEKELGTCAAASLPAGVAAFTCAVPVGSACVDISSAATGLGSYLKAMPADPTYGSAAQTYYSVIVDANNIVTVKSCTAENSASISQSR